MATGIEATLHFGKAGLAAPQRIEEATPFRILVIGDLCGGRAGRPPFGERRPQRIDAENLDAVLAHFAPALSIRSGDATADAVDVAFESLDDFEPDALFRRLPLFARMRDLRSRLSDARTFAQAAAELRTDAQHDPDTAAAPGEDDNATLARLLGTSTAAPPQPAKTGATVPALDRFIRALVAPHVVADTGGLQAPLIASLDLAISATMRMLLQHPDWRAVEGCWRAIDRFVRQVETGERVVVELLDASASELLGDLAGAHGQVADSALLRMFAEERTDGGGGEDCALIVCLFEFGPAVGDIALLAGLGATAARLGAVLLAGAAPALIDIGLPDRAGRAASRSGPGREPSAGVHWAALRASPVARHVGLIWPRVLSRLPYGARTEPIDAFAFEELANSFAHERLAWRPAALDCAALLAQGWVEDGAAMDANERLAIEDFPAYVDRSQDPPRLQAVAEQFLGAREVAAAQALGVMSLVSHRTLPHARLAGWHSIALDGAPLAGRWTRFE